VLVETVWVLKSLYGFPKKQIVETLEHLVNNQAFVLESETLCRDALILYRGTNVSFSDAMILVNSRQKGYSLLTFDKKLVKLDGTTGVS
jgi:predicted nucleic-acid-binding protein